MPIPWNLDLPLRDYTIMINPGHGCKNSKGAIDRGASGKLADGTTIFESDLNDKNAMKIKNKLLALGANIIYLDNKTPADVQEIEAQIKPDVFLFIHHNACEYKCAKGREIYAWSEGGLQLANIICKKLESDATIKENKMNSFNINHAKNLRVLRVDKTVPAVLIEPGYMTNPNDLKILNSQEYQEELSQNIVEGIEEFLKTNRKKDTKTELTQEAKNQLLVEKLTNPFVAYPKN